MLLNRRRSGPEVRRAPENPIASLIKFQIRCPGSGLSLLPVRVSFSHSHQLQSSDRFRNRHQAAGGHKRALATPEVATYRSFAARGKRIDVVDAEVSSHHCAGYLRNQEARLMVARSRIVPFTGLLLALVVPSIGLTRYLPQVAGFDPMYVREWFWWTLLALVLLYVLAIERRPLALSESAGQPAEQR